MSCGDIVTEIAACSSGLASFVIESDSSQHCAEKAKQAANGKEVPACVVDMGPETIAKVLSRGQSPTSRSGVQLQWAVPKIAEGAVESKEVKCASERVRMVRCCFAENV